MPIVEIIVGLLVCAAVGTWILNVRVRRIAVKRKGEGFETFAATFQSNPIEQEVMHSVYDCLQEWMSGTAAYFPVRTTDNLHTIYGLAEEDLEDQILKLLKICGRYLPNEGKLKQMRPIDTVSQLVAFIADCPVKEAFSNSVS